MSKQEQIRSMRATGASYTTIAKALGVSKATIVKALADTSTPHSTADCTGIRASTAGVSSIVDSTPRSTGIPNSTSTATSIHAVPPSVPVSNAAPDFTRVRRAIAKAVDALGRRGVAPLDIEDALEPVRLALAEVETSASSPAQQKAPVEAVAPSDADPLAALV